MTIAKTRLYGIIVDEDDLPDHSNEKGYWAFETFGDGFSSEKRMDDIIITAANHSTDPANGAYRGGLNRPTNPDDYGRHFTWQVPATAFEEPKREA